MEYKILISKNGDSKEISLENYESFIRLGTNQDDVIKARAELSRGQLDLYRSTEKGTHRVKYLSGYAQLIIGDDNIEDIKKDKYTSIIHKSFNGLDNIVLIRIDDSKYQDSVLGIFDYYFSNFGIVLSGTVHKPERTEPMSYDPDIFYNDRSSKFTPKNIKRHKIPSDTDYVYTQSDFASILDEIKNKGIDLVQKDYFRYARILSSIAVHFKDAGQDIASQICPDYNVLDDYHKFLSHPMQGASIGLLYYYVKESGINVYSDKTKTIINRVKLGKTQGNPTVNSIVSNLLSANEIEATEEDKDLIKRLLKDQTDYSINANSGVKEIEQMESFIMDMYAPSLDVITNMTYINGDTVLTDTEVNDIYLKLKKHFKFNIPVNDVRAIINSNSIKKINILDDFLNANQGNPSGVIEQYASCIHPQSEYNLWAFKKWIVGALHNWTARRDEKLVCPLTLVLTGQQHGTGKTSFLRNIMPEELNKYIVEAKINGHDKDSMYTLCNSLLVLDDEFGGKAFKDVKEYKAISDINIITQRRPYEREAKTFKRRAILCGTTNEVDILKDVTGNRRILPINVERIDYDRVLSINKTDLIVEAYNLLKSGFDWIIRTQDDIEYLRINSTQNENVLPIEEVFFNHFSLEATASHNIERVMNQGEILEYLNIWSVLKPNKYDLKEILTKNKIKYQTHRHGFGSKSGIKLYLRPGNCPVD